jgi:hypothetical protein
VFHERDGKYFLAKVAGPAGAVARRVPTSKVEKELIFSTGGASPDTNRDGATIAANSSFTAFIEHPLFVA